MTPANPARQGLFNLDGCCSGSGFEAYRIAQLFEAGLGLLQLCVQLLAVSEAVQFYLGQLDILDNALGVFLDLGATLDQLLVNLVGLGATRFELFLQAVELILDLVESLAVEAEAGQERIAAGFLGAGGEIRCGLTGSSLLGRCFPGSRLTLGRGLALGGSLLRCGFSRFLGWFGHCLSP